MKCATLFHIAHEGWWILTPLLALAVVFYLIAGWWLALPVLVIALICGRFFHDYPRHIVADPAAITAPVDGVIISQEPCHDPFLNRPARKISIRINRFGAYYLRAPVEGTTLELTRLPSRYAQKTSSCIRNDQGDRFVLNIRKGGLLTSRPCQGSLGQRIGQARCCGVRRLAKQIDLYLPRHYTTTKKDGQHIQAGKDILARLPQP